MTKTEIIEKMAVKAGISKIAAGVTLEAFIECIEKALKKGDRITLVGFGTFQAVKRKARTGRNPRTGESIKIPAAKVPKFTPSSRLKDILK